MWGWLPPGGFKNWSIDIISGELGGLYGMACAYDKNDCDMENTRNGF